MSTLFPCTPSPKAKKPNTTSARSGSASVKPTSNAAEAGTWRAETLRHELKRLLEWLARESYIPPRKLYCHEKLPPMQSSTSTTVMQSSMQSSTSVLGSPPPLCHVLGMPSAASSSNMPVKRPATTVGMEMNSLKRIKLEHGQHLLSPSLTGATPQLNQSRNTPIEVPWPFTDREPEWMAMLRSACFKRGSSAYDDHDVSSGSNSLYGASKITSDLFSEEADDSTTEWLFEEGFVRGESLVWRLIYKRNSERVKVKKNTKASSSVKSVKPKAKDTGK